MEALSFIEAIEEQNALVSIGIGNEESEQTLAYYVEFLIAVDHILFERKTQLLPRQTNVFTTNYDVFIEQAAGRLTSFILNDGFDRTSSRTGKYEFAPEQFFDRTYRSRSVHSRQAQVPTVNLIKLHGSLTWKKTVAGIVFRQKDPKELSDEDRDDN